MLLTLCNNRPDMLICQGIKDGFAFSAALDQAALFEDAQLMLDRRLRHIQSFRQIADTHFRLKQDEKNPNSCSVSENFK